MKEMWRDIIGYENLYQVSNMGKIKSLKNNNILSPANHRDHLRVGLVKNGVRRYYYVHQLVAKAFIPNPNNYDIVNHKDENPKNNRVDNLEWCTQKHNCNYGNRNIKIKISQVANYIKTSGDLELYQKLMDFKNEKFTN